MMMIYEPTCPHHAECTAVFDQKQHDPHVPHSLFTESYSKGHFIFVSPDEKSPQREMFCQCERGETKNDRSTKRHQNQGVQKLFGAVEKHLNRCTASKGEFFEGD